MSKLRDLHIEIATSIFILPCTEEELFNRSFLKNYSKFGIQRIVMWLEKEAIYYKGNTMYIYKNWAKKNLHQRSI